MVAPLGALPALAVLDLTACPRLGYLFVQAPLLHTLLLDQCAALGKARRRPRPAGPRAWPGTARTAGSQSATAVPCRLATALPGCAASACECGSPLGSRRTGCHLLQAPGHVAHGRLRRAGRAPAVERPPD